MSDPQATPPTEAATVSRRGLLALAASAPVVGAAGAAGLAVAPTSAHALPLRHCLRC